MNCSFLDSEYFYTKPRGQGENPGKGECEIIRPLNLSVPHPNISTAELTEQASATAEPAMSAVESPQMPTPESSPPVISEVIPETSLDNFLPLTSLV